MRRSFGMSLPAALAFVWFAAPAQATVAYQNTTTAVTAYVFNGASASTLATNIDINLLTLMPGFAGDVVSSISFRAYNSNGASVAAGLVFDVWATNGTGGLPGRSWPPRRSRHFPWGRKPRPPWRRRSRAA